MDRVTTVHPYCNSTSQELRSLPVYPEGGNYRANGLLLYYLRKHIGLSEGFKPDYAMKWADSLEHRYEAYKVNGLFNTRLSSAIDILTLVLTVRGKAIQ